MLWIVRFAEEEVPQPELLCLDLQVFDDRDDGLPSLLVVRGQLGMSNFDSRLYFFLL